MDTLSTHYARLLGLDDSWRVDAVDLRLDERRVEIRLAHVGSGVSCPECGQSCGLADHAEERRWRHLDTMQFTTELVARLPRCRCPEVRNLLANGSPEHTFGDVVVHGPVDSPAIRGGQKGRETRPLGSAGG